VGFARVWQRLLGVERTVVESVMFDEDGGLPVAYARPRRGARQRCGRSLVQWGLVPGHWSKRLVPVVVPPRWTARRPGLV
jgi:hypothetical protein